ncbi:hypothetical protein BD560DRAFT_424160 [Blakeslea trispora]|nr:hypothetical protein BD560DRAFT_424160 [Blakeslea trispora]
MAWVGSLPLSLGERLLVNLVMTHSSCIPKDVLGFLSLALWPFNSLAVQQDGASPWVFSFKPRFDIDGERNSKNVFFLAPARQALKVWLKAPRPMRRMNERPKETQKVQKVSYTCQKPPDSDSFYLSVGRQKLSDSGGSLTLSFNRESCPYFDTVRHWSDTPRF